MGTGEYWPSTRDRVHNPPFGNGKIIIKDSVVRKSHPKQSWAPYVHQLGREWVWRSSKGPLWSQEVIIPWPYQQFSVPPFPTISSTQWQNFCASARRSSNTSFRRPPFPWKWLMLWPQLSWKHSQPLAFFLLGFLGDIFFKAAQVLSLSSYEINRWLLRFYPKMNVVFQNTAKPGRWIQVHMLPWDTRVFLWNQARPKSPTDSKETWVSSIQTIMSKPRDAKILKIKKIFPIHMHLPSKLWIFHTNSPTHPPTTTHIKLKGYSDIHLPTYPCGKSPIKSPIKWVCIDYNPQESTPTMATQ